MTPLLNIIPAPGLFLVGFFLAPLILWLLLGQAESRRPTGWRRLLFPSGVALCSLLGCLLFVASTEWTKDTEIAWTSIESAKDLRIGGAPESALIGWPNRSFSPALQVKSDSPTTATITMSLGGGFIQDQSRGKFLNGEPLSIDQPRTIGTYTLSLSKSWYSWNYTIAVRESGRQVADFELPAGSISRDRVYTLSALIGSGPRGGVFDEDWFRLKDWAEEVLLLQTTEAEIRILTADETQSDRVALPAELVLHFPSLRQRMRLSHVPNGNLRLDFRAPWRLASPLPPMENRAARLTVSGQPLPGELAFPLPLGREAGNFRQAYDLTEKDGRAPMFMGPESTIVDPKVAGGPMLPPQFKTTAPTDCDTQAGIVSQQRVSLAPGTNIHLSTIEDLPQRAVLLILMLIALTPLVAGFWLTLDRLSGVSRWCIYGLALCLWNLLVFRLMLAFRYALDPRHLDLLAVGGLAKALAALGVAPGLILLVARLRLDWNDLENMRARERKAVCKHIYFFVLLLGVVYGVESCATSRLWVNLPEYLQYRPGYDAMLIAQAAMIFFWLMALVMYGSARESRHRVIRSAFLWPLVLIENWIDWCAKRWERLITGRPRPKTTLVYAFGAAVVFIVLPYALAFVFSFISRFRYVDTILHDLVVPFFFCWPVAVFWLASRTKIGPGRKGQGSSFWAILACAVLTILLPGFLLPVFISDPGSLYGMLSVLLPLTMFLGIARIWKPFAAALTAFLLTFVLASILYLNLDVIISVVPSELVPDRAVPRLLIFREGNRVQRYLPVASSGRKDEARSFHASEIRNGVQHVWENNAIAVNGGFLGLGFGQAPSRESRVRHDTLTYDSVHSFFVQSEYGLVGAIGLLLLYCCPLLLVLASGRKHIGFGHAVAYLITAALLSEALIHAAMNLAMLPYTGRNLPLQSVNSFTDLLRWTILFAIAAQAVLWHEGSRGRDKPHDYIFLGASRPLFRRRDPVVNPETDGYPRWDWALLATVALPLGLLIWITFRGAANLLEKDYNSAFTWSPFLDTVQNIIDKKDLTFDPKTFKIDPPKVPLPAESLLNQEIARFNALPEEERKQERGLKEFYEWLNRVSTLPEYDELMDRMRIEYSARALRRQRPSLFQLIPEEVEGKVTYHLAVNKAFNSEFKFSKARLPEEFPKTVFRDGRTMLIGPAWVMGRWTLAYDPRAPLPWTRHLADAVRSEWEDNPGPEVLKRFSQLTLDPELQKAVTEFAAEKGREVHARVLLQKERDPKRKTPPRVAISIVSLPDGEVLAMGGWPHMSSEDLWVREKSGEWIPPAQWIESRIPKALQNRYGGDRNFDLMLMGSATKPLWASVVYSLHPNLSGNFSVRGPGGDESEVFGIKIEPAWDAGREISHWLGLDEYLKISNNRFQVRLGFLGLAEDLLGEAAADAGYSPSDRESMDGRSPWHRYPKFPVDIGFSQRNPNRMANLDRTPLAEQWYRMYSVNKDGRLHTYRRSFWTGNENDDVKGKESVNSPFDSISPAIPDFGFEGIDHPRQYVNLLLGGAGNRWANVDFAAAFGTCLTGIPVVPQIVEVNQNITLPQRLQFTKTASKLLIGLRAAAMNIGGTANNAWRKTTMQSFLNSLPDIEVYAKTGTLDEDDKQIRDFNRIVLALIRWEHKGKGIVKNGVVVSMIGEDIGVGAAAAWAGEFLANKPHLKWLLIE